MVYLYTDDQPLPDNHVRITVESFFRTHQWTVVASPSDAIRELACMLQELADASVFEMSFFPLMENGTPYPYPLRDDMFLRQLQEEHRTLILLVHENPEKAIPRRLIVASSDPQRWPILNMMEATDDDIPYLSRWITYSVGSVYLPWAHPRFPEMMSKIVEELDSVEFPRHFPKKYYLMGPPQEMTLIQRNALLRFIRLIGQDRVFRRVEVYAAKGICGNTEEEPMMLTKENMSGVDLLIADAIEQRER